MQFMICKDFILFLILSLLFTATLFRLTSILSCCSFLLVINLEKILEENMTQGPSVLRCITHPLCLSSFVFSWYWCKSCGCWWSSLPCLNIVVCENTFGCTHCPQISCMYMCLVTQLHPALCNPLDCIPPGSSVHGFPRQGYWSGVPLPSWGSS